MPYADLASIHTPATGAFAPAAWGLQIRANFEALIDPPACSVFASASQSVASSSTTTLTADSENYDNDGMHSTVSNTSRITIQTPGRYLFSARVSFAAGNSGIRQVLLYRNGAEALGSCLLPTAGGGFSTSFVVTTTALMSAGDYVETRVLHTQGTNLAVTLAEFSALRITR